MNHCRTIGICRGFLFWGGYIPEVRYHRPEKLQFDSTWKNTQTKKKKTHLVGGFNPFAKYSSNFDHFPNIRDENTKIVEKPSPSQPNVLPPTLVTHGDSGSSTPPSNIPRLVHLSNLAGCCRLDGSKRSKALGRSKAFGQPRLDVSERKCWDQRLGDMGYWGIFLCRVTNLISRGILDFTHLYWINRLFHLYLENLGKYLFFLATGRLGFSGVQVDGN